MPVDDSLLNTVVGEDGISRPEKGEDKPVKPTAKKPPGSRKAAAKPAEAPSVQDRLPPLWSELDEQTRVMEVAGIGCVLQTRHGGMLLIPGASLNHQTGRIERAPTSGGPGPRILHSREVLKS